MSSISKQYVLYSTHDLLIHAKQGSGANAKVAVCPSSLSVPFAGQLDNDIFVR